MTTVSNVANAVPLKYKGYFGPDSAFAKLPSLALNTPGEVFALVAALMTLEKVDVASLLATAPGAAKSPVGFSEFDVGNKKPLTYAQMRRVWLRRVAVSLWSDANSHWYWYLKDSIMNLSQWDLLLGWNPEHDDLDNPNSPGYIAVAGGSAPTKADYFQGLLPSSQPKSISRKNGNYIFQTPGGQFHFSALWNPDPFQSWHIAWTAIRPLLGQQKAPGDLTPLFVSLSAANAAMSAVPATSRFSAILALTNFLRATGYNHPSNWAGNPDYASVVWPHANLFAPQYDWAKTPPPEFPAATVYPATTCSFSDVWSSGFGMCHHTAPLFQAILRSMNVPVRVCFVPIPPTHAGFPREVFDLKGSLKHAKLNSRFLGPNHLSVAADIADAPVAVYHADDICSYHANRFADAGFSWVPLNNWLSTTRLAAIAQAAALDPTIAYAIDDDGGQWPFRQIVRLRETQTRANLAAMAQRVAQAPWSSWLSSYAFALNATDGSGPSWLDRWKAATKLGPAAAAIAPVAADFFELDSAVPDLVDQPAIGKFGHWGLTRFPINWYAGDVGQGQDFATFGLAADAQVQETIGKIVAAIELSELMSAIAGKIYGVP